LPEALEPDDLVSYELGAKLGFLQERLHLRAAVYHVDWKGVPVMLGADCGIGFPVNAGRVESRGFELEGSALLTDRWAINFGFSRAQTELAEDHPFLGKKGDPLPGSPEYLASVGAEYSFTAFQHDSWVRLDWAWVDEYYNNLAKDGEVLGDYHEVNMVAGIELNPVILQLFINNAADSDKILWNDTNYGDGRVQRQRPRTVGLLLRYRF
jgi:iron complex outermembrane receptor protein